MLRAALLLPPVCLAPVLTPGELRRAPREGHAVDRAVEVRWDVSLDEFTVNMGGNPVPQEYLPRMDFDMAHTLKLAATDRFVAVTERRPTRLLRSFEQAESSTAVNVAIDGETATESLDEGESPLVGREVLFTWQDAADDYEPSLPDGSTDDPVLTDLVADLDLSALLPGEGAEEGHRWKVPAEAFSALLYPAGDLKIDEGGERAPEDPRMRPMEGEVVLVYEGLREVDGRRCARVAIEARVTSALDYETDLDEVPVADGDADETMTTKVDVEGHLLWDAAAGRLHSAEVAGDMTLVIHTVQRLEDDTIPPYEHKFTLTGDWSASFTVRPSE